MYSKIYVPIDFSPYSKFQLLLAEKWARILKAELVLIHATRIYVPGIADEATRETLKSDSKQEVHEKLTRLTDEYISSDLPVKFHIAETSITDALRQLTEYTDSALICVGLKGKGLLQKVFMGSTSVDIINSINKPVLTVPKHADNGSLEQFIVAVNHEQPLNTSEFDKVVKSFKTSLKWLKFITILNSDAQKEDAIQYLENLVNHYQDELPSSYEIYGGGQPFLQVKAVMQQYKNSLLVVQKGSRDLTDQLFRSFFINQIVYDASIPLLVIPTMTNWVFLDDIFK